MLDMTGLLRLDTYLPPSEKVVPGPDTAYPAVVEGFDWNVRNPLERYFANSSFHFPLNKLRIPDERATLLLALIFAIVFILLCAIAHLRKDKADSDLFLTGVLICLLSDFFIPIPRFPYYDIQMLLLLLIIISKAKPKDLVGRKANIALCLGLWLSVAGFVVVPKALLFSAWLIALYVSITSVSLLIKSNPAE